MVLALASAARADFNPVPLTPGSFTADVVVEKTAPRPFSSYTTATMDGGTNNNNWTLYEQGFDVTRPGSGLPAAGSTFTAYSEPNHQFKMPASYAANNALCVYSGIPSATLTLVTPAALNAISILNSGGGGSSTINYTVHHQGGGVESGTLAISDWYGSPTTIACVLNGRVNMNDGTLGEVNTGNPKIFYNDIFLTDQINPVTSIDFSSTSGNKTAVLAVSGTGDNINYTNVPVTGFNRDMVVEAGVTPTGFNLSKCNVTLDGATNNSGATLYEQGFNTGSPLTGVPKAGTSVSGGSPAMTFTMPPTYTTNNVIFVGNYAGFTGQPGENTLTLATPAAYTGLSFLGTSGGGSVSVNVTVNHQDNFPEYLSITLGDWYNGANPFVTLSNRFYPQSLGFDGNGNNPRLYTNSIVLASASPVTSIQFVYASGGGKGVILAVAGETSSGGAFSAVPVTGYNADAIVESGVPRYPNPLYTATTVSMDEGTNNFANTWMERGYYPLCPNAGLPAPGTIIDSLAQPDHHYQMPASYTANNAVYVDYAHTEANLTLVTPNNYSALSFLSGTANGNVTNQVVMQYMDGTQETNTFVSRDWFGNTPYAYTAWGRVDLNRRTINNDPGRSSAQNPRLYEAQFALGNTVSPITNVLLRYLGSADATRGRMVVLAVSATAGAVQPIISTISPQPVPVAMEGSNITITATVTGGTAPISYQWQVGTNGVWVDLQNGGNIAGATTTTLNITSIGWTNVADYRMVATNIAGFGISPITTVSQVLSGLQDVTLPTDPCVAYQPDGGSFYSNEAPPRALDNTTSKYLNFGSGSAPLSVPIGFVVSPPRAGSIVSVLRFYTANDSTDRDPASYLFEGSVDGGATFTTIASGALSLPDGRNDGGLALDPLNQNIQEVRLANTTGYTSYRLSFSSVKGNTTLMQIGEVELLGVTNPNSVPTIVQAPVDTTVNENTTATFSVTAVGPGTLSYQWYNVTAGDPGTLLGGQTTATLTLPGVTAAMNGNKYRVVVTSEHGSVTAPSTTIPGAQLNVNSGTPLIQTELATEGVVYAGRTAVLPVTIVGTEPFILQWQKDLGNLSDTGRILGSHSNVLTIANAQLSDAGTYQLASIQNAYGNTNSVAQSLVVQTVPALTLNGAGWVLNGLKGADPSPATVLSGVLELSAGVGDTRRSAWYQYPLYIGAFKASFVYQALSGPNGADGIAFAFQNDPAGTAALGGGGGGLGFSSLTPSAALEFNIYGDAGIAFNTNGNTGGYSTTGSVVVDSGDPIDVAVTYTPGVLSLTLSNTTTTATFSTNITVPNLPAVLGKDTAYVGLTGADGGIVSQQQVSNFKFIPLPTLAARSAGGALVLAWPASIGGYKLQSSASIITPSWVDAGLTESLVGNEYQATVGSPTGSLFYRLVLTP